MVIHAVMKFFEMPHHNTNPQLFLPFLKFSTYDAQSIANKVLFNSLHWPQFVDFPFETIPDSPFFFFANFSIVSGACSIYDGEWFLFSFLFFSLSSTTMSIIWGFFALLYGPTGLWHPTKVSIYHFQ